MNISVNYDDTDVAKLLSKIIKDPNAEEFVKLLTPMVCGSSNATQHFFKLMIGSKLPQILPNGTLCKMKVDSLGYTSNKDLIKAKYADENEMVIVTILEFRGFHEYSPYAIKYNNVLDDGSVQDGITYVRTDELEIIEDF